MSVKIQDFRIGNYIKALDGETSSLILHSKGIAEITADAFSFIESEHIKVEPIPLNHFWFKEFGFDRQKKTVKVKNGLELEYHYIKSFKYDDKSYKFNVWSNEDGTFFSMYEFIRGSIDYKSHYVHNLQNIYYELTSQSLIRKFK